MTRPLAVIGSPSSNDEIVVDVLEGASEGRIVGRLCYFDLRQDDRELRVTGQLTRVEMRNRFHENDLWRNVLKTDGTLPHLSGNQDVRTATIAPGAVFARRNADEPWSQDVLGTVPSTGTSVISLGQDVLDDLVSSIQHRLVTFGRAYGDDSVALPMYLRHFGPGASGGQGEAYHSLVVGKTGSGKSTLAKFMLAGYARHEDMAILIVDPKGEFADEIAGYAVGDSGLPLRSVLAGMGRQTVRHGISRIRLEGYELFCDVMGAIGLDRDLNIRGPENKQEFARTVEELMRSGRCDFNLDNLRPAENLRAVLEAIIDEEDGFVDRIYKSKEPQDALRKEIERIIVNPTHRIWATWDFLGFLFERGDGSRRTVGQIVRDIMESPTGERPFAVLDLSISGNRRDLEDLGDAIPAAADDERDLFTDALQKKIVHRIVSDMRRLSETIVSERMRSADRRDRDLGVNTLVVFEEAHRFAPKNVPSEDEDARKLKAKLIEGVRETRKYGLGWFFVDQTVGGLDREIIQQIRCFYFGFGLAMGEELDRLREIVGGDPRDVALYRSFRDPAAYASAADKRFPWMAFGPVSPMAANHPLFFNAFDGASFVRRNALPSGDGERGNRLAMGAGTKADMRRRNRGTGGHSVALEDLPDDILG